MSASTAPTGARVAAIAPRRAASRRGSRAARAPTRRRARRAFVTAANDDASAADGDEDEDARPPSAEDLDAEARELLQWPELSAQVRAFTATTLGMRACTPELPLGATPEESARLLAETTAAATLRARGGFPREVFEGTRDIRAFVAGAARGRVLSGSSLADIATTVAACAAVLRHVSDDVPEDASADADASASSAAPLRRLAQPLARIPDHLEPEIRRCVLIPGGSLLDDASPALASIRAERRETEKTLRALLNEKAQFLARKNFAERAQVVTRLGRECVPMKAGAQSEMEGVVLGASGTGATVFKEPAEAVPLNNRLLELAAEEDAETEAVLRALTDRVLGDDEGEALREATEALGRLDLAAARASHAAWLGARPARLAVDGPDSDARVSLPGMQHPLLLEPRLPRLPRGGKVGADEETEGWDEDDTDEDEDEDEDEGNARVENRAEVRDVVPVDFVVPPETTLVAITGPNTGGKTASLKALGLALLMARAGLHLPTDDSGTASVPWTAHVLADLGDAQSLDLEGGLSTFSAHLTRLQNILRASREANEAAPDGRGRVVVLLDEPGGGTDPAEGAALASAVLRASAARSTLTVATSHYEEVKALALGDDASGRPAMPGAANAAVEFDPVTLRPTYRLLWGSSGESNALAIARGLGLSEDLVAAAERRWRRQQRAAARAASLGDGDGGEDDGDDEAAELAEALDRERQTQTARAEAAAAALDRAADLHAEVTARAAAHLNLRVAIAVEAAEARLREGLEEAEAIIGAATTREALDEAAEAMLPDGWTLDERGEATPGARREGGGGEWRPKVGATVTVRQLGGAEAEVVGLDENAGEVLVKMGSITTRAPIAGVAPAGR